MKTLTSLPSFLLFITVVLGALGCSDNVVQPFPEIDDTKNTGPVEAPCALDTNKTYGINGETLSYYYTSAGEDQAFYGNYGVQANGTGVDLRFDFKKAPETGKYVTTNDPTHFNWSDNQCGINGTFGSPFSYHYVAARGDTVYVNKLGENQYHISFCKATLSGSSQITFTTKGNITVQ